MVTIQITSELPLISCIEIPGSIVGTGNQAVRALGGEVALSRVLGHGASEWFGSTPIQNKQSNHGAVFLRCNPEDRFSKFLVSSTTRRSDVLLQIRRHRKTGEILHANPIGLIIERISFESMADFYCTPPEISRDIKFSVDLELSENVGEPLFIPPSTFTRIITPFNYKYENNAFATTANYFTRRKQKREQPSQQTPTHTEEIHSIVQPTTEKTTQIPQLEETATSTETQCETTTSQEINDETRLIMFPDYHGSSGNQLVRRKGRDDAFNAVSRFSDTTVPKEPPLGALQTSADPELLQRYQQLFQQRPLWLRATLDQNIPNNITLWKKKPALAKTCFLLSDGPWRGASCRLGYDPRQDPSSRRFQTIDFRDPYFRSVSWRTHSTIFSPESQATSSSGPNRTGSSITFTPKAVPRQRPQGSFIHEETTNIISLDELRFQVPPSRPSQLFQLCDIDDPGVQRLVESSPVLPTCSKESGWYSKEVMTKIRDLMLMSSKRMRESRENTA